MNYFSLCQLVGVYFSFTFLTAHMVSKHMSVLHLWSTQTELLALFDLLFLSTLSLYISSLMLKKKPTNKTKKAGPHRRSSDVQGVFAVYGTQLCF